MTLFSAHSRRLGMTYPEARALEKRRMRRLDAVLQVAIFVLTFSWVCMANFPGPWTAWSPVVGILSQPFWMVASWRARQWGMFALAILFCVPFANGIRLSFF